jgi:hypothetical protein
MQGQLLTIFFNPASSKLKPNAEFGIAFNGKSLQAPLRASSNMFILAFCIW